MKKQLSKISMALALLSSAVAFSQQPKIPCTTYEAMEAHFAADPSARTNFENAQKQLQAQLNSSQNSSARPAAFEYTVPVVFHILHQGGPENISDAACIAALDQINKDYARLSPDTNQIFAPFKSKYVNSEIKFMLAKKDPQGNCINGIVRHVDPKSNWSQSAASNSFYWPYTWDPTRYLNIYIVGNIVSSGTVTGGGIVVGYTYIPGTWPTGNAHDAIVYRYNFLGVNFPIPDSRSLSHEIGHWLSLPHTFGNTNNPGVVCGDDNIADTPPTKGNFASCPAASTNTNFTCSSPNPANANNYYQNVENIMDYSSCAKNFTQGQTTAMRNTLAGTVSNRQNLWQSANLAFTGINNFTPCAPVAEFLSANLSYTVCQGQNLLMKDFSYNGAVTSLVWSANNSAVVAAPGATQTSINFPVLGATDVSLTVSNAQGTSTKVRTVYVLDGTAAITGPYSESFENPGVPADWYLIDVENDNKTWMQTSQAAYDQSYSFYIEGATMPASTTDMLQMPMMDVKNNSGNVLEFAYAFRRNNSSQNDVLKIEGSRDCGGTWDDIVVLSANTMAQNSGGTSTDPFFPQPEEWKIYTISAHPKWLNYINSTSVLVKFTFVEGTNGYGNNMFIDAVNFFSPTGINELSKSVGFALYPNPTTDEAFVHFNLNDAAKIKISVLDILGKEISTVTDQSFGAGEQTIAINKNNDLKPGVYFVKMTVNGATISSKLIVK